MRRKKHASEGADGKANPEERASGGKRSPSSLGSNAGRLTPADIQQVEFRRGFKGYDEREVDEFLDRLTEDFAAAVDELRRAREPVDAGLGVAGAADLDAVNRQADEILRRARDEAATIAREAGQRAAFAGSGGAADRAAISPFITREREFLRSLASLVQEHAEDVKAMARAAASTPAPEPAPTPDPSAAPEPASEAEPPATPAPAPPSPSEAIHGAESATTSSGREERTIQLPEPTPTSAGSSDESDSPPRAEDRSLRELFWGED